MEFPPCPATLKPIQHYLKVAQEHDGRDIVVSYWSRLYALQVGLKISSQKPEETKLLMALMDWLEAVKKEHSDNEAITNDVAAQAHLENYALKLFLYADKNDRESNFGKNVVKAFYSSGVLYDVMQTFGDLTEEATHNRKYAKWKAAYIHNCLKNGETPIPGPMANPEEENMAGDGAGGADGEEAASGSGGMGSPEFSPPPTAGEADAGAGAAPGTDSAEENESDLPPQDINPSPPSTTPPTADEVLNNPNKLPSPPVEEEKPGGFVPYVPPAQPTPMAYVPPTPKADLQLTAEQINKAQKYSKYACSALNYDDVKTAVENLQKAIVLLTTGEDT